MKKNMKALQFHVSTKLFLLNAYCSTHQSYLRAYIMRVTPVPDETKFTHPTCLFLALARLGF